MIPVDPRPFTLRELLWLAEGARRERWSRMSSLMALTANVSRDPRRCRAFKPADFDPFADARAGEPIVFDKTTAPLLRKAMTGN